MDKLEFTIQVFLLGFSVVLVTLFVLYAIIILFNKIFQRPESSIVPRTEAAVTPELKANNNTLSPKVIAVITAAVTEYLKTDDGISAPLKITVQPHTSAVSGWAVAGRKSLMNNREVIERLRRRSLHENF